MCTANVNRLFAPKEGDRRKWVYRPEICPPMLPGDAAQGVSVKLSFDGALGEYCGVVSAGQAAGCQA